MMGVMLANGAFTNDAGKQFSTGIYKRKTLGKVIVIFQGLLQSNFDIILLIMVAHNLGTQIKGLYKLVPVTKGKLFVSY